MRGTERSTTGMQGTERARGSDREVVCVGGLAKHRASVRVIHRPADSKHRL